MVLILFFVNYFQSGVPETPLKTDKAGHDRLIAYLAEQVEEVLKVSKVQEVNGTKLYTVAKSGNEQFSFLLTYSKVSDMNTLVDS